MKTFLQNRMLTFALAAITLLGLFAIGTEAGVDRDALLRVLAVLGGGAVVFGSFYTDDDMIKYLIAVGFLDSAGGYKFNVVAKTGDYTIVAPSSSSGDRSGTVFTNRGAGGAVTFTLPAAAQNLRGVFYRFFGIADQNIIVAAGTVDTLVVINDAAADSLAIQTSSVKIGAGMEVFCDGTAWVAYGINVGVGGTAATYTVAT